MTVLLLKSQKFDKICLSGKVKPNKNTVDWSELILKRNTKFSNQKSTTKPRCMLPFQKGMGEMSDKQKNYFLPVCNSVKIINVHYVALQLDLATLYPSNFPVNCEISFIWIAILRRQVDVLKTVYFSCIVHLHKYFFSTFVIFAAFV